MKIQFVFLMAISFLSINAYSASVDIDCRINLIDSAGSKSTFSQTVFVPDGLDPKSSYTETFNFGEFRLEVTAKFVDAYDKKNSRTKVPALFLVIWSSQLYKPIASGNSSIAGTPVSLTAMIKGDTFKAVCAIRK